MQVEQVLKVPLHVRQGEAHCWHVLLMAIVLEKQAVRH